MQTRENPPYKGGCPKIGLDRRGGMNQNTPNPGLALRWPHPCSLPIEWSRWGCPPNVNLRPRVVLDAQVWLPARDGDGICCPLQMALWLTPEESAGQRLWRGQRIFQQTPSNIRRRNQRAQTSVTTNYHMRLVEFSHVALEDPWLRGWPLNKINSFHNNIWFDYIFLSSNLSFY